MEHYISSRGYQEGKGYTWYRIDTINLQENRPLFLDKVGDLVTGGNFNLVVARMQSHLILYVSGLKGKRQDFMRRQIYNSFAFVTTDPDEDKSVCQLAAYLLGDEPPQIALTVT